MNVQSQVIRVPGEDRWLAIILIPEGTALPDEKLRVHILIKIVRNPSRSHPVSPLPDTLPTGESETPYSFLPHPWACVPTSCFPLPLLLILCGHLQIFPSVYALSRWASVSSYPPTTPLISWAGSTVSLCSKKSWHAALWTGCWRRNTELSPLPRWSWFPSCRVSFGGTQLKIAV